MRFSQAQVDVMMQKARQSVRRSNLYEQLVFWLLGLVVGLAIGYTYSILEKMSQ